MMNIRIGLTTDQMMDRLATQRGFFRKPASQMTESEREMLVHDVSKFYTFLSVNGQVRPVNRETGDVLPFYVKDMAPELRSTMALREHMVKAFPAGSKITVIEPIGRGQYAFVDFVDNRGNVCAVCEDGRKLRLVPGEDCFYRSEV